MCCVLQGVRAGELDDRIDEVEGNDHRGQRRSTLPSCAREVHVEKSVYELVLPQRTLWIPTSTCAQKDENAPQERDLQTRHVHNKRFHHEDHAVRGRAHDASTTKIRPARAPGAAAR